LKFLARRRRKGNEGDLHGRQAAGAAQPQPSAKKAPKAVIQLVTLNFKADTIFRLTL
jgi:hypothetical protein